MAVSEEQLLKLTRIIEAQSVRHPISPLLQCPHIHYSSPQSFVNHLIWILNADTIAAADDIEVHYKLMIELFRVHSLCGVCRNLILSNVPLNKVLLDPAQPIRLESWRCCFYLEFHLRLFSHPKFAKMIINSGSKSLPALQSLCMVLDSLLIGVQKEGGLVHSEMFGAFTLYEFKPHFKQCHGHGPKALFASIYARTLYMSLRYWNMDHMLFYSGDYGRQRNSPAARHWAWMGTFDKPPSDVSMQSLFCLINRMVTEAMSKVIQMKLESMLPRRAAIHSQRKSLLKKDIAGSLRESVCCSFIHCQTEASSHCLKLCGGCKMTYFCSRSCQKKAWSQHKCVCKALAERFPL